jgi:hypothetical protein
VQGIELYLRFFAEHPEFVELFILERAEFKDRTQPRYFSQVESEVRAQRLIAQLIEQGRLRDVPEQRIMTVMGDLLYGTIFTNLIAGRRRPYRDQAQDILDILFHGLLTPSEQRRLQAGREGEA